jgi:4-amino-4-deoxy-L-arabinose transferase-like glycosyltransferase
MALGETAAVERSGGAGRNTLLLFGIIALAVALRFWQLGQWGFDSDEVFMLRDSLDPRLTNPRPLLYFLNHYIVQPLMPLHELSLRLLPAVFGVLAIPTIYFVGRRLVGARAALFAAFFVAVSPLHVYYSQFARYWSLVFLLAAIYPYAIYLGIRERNRGWLAFGLLTGVLAVLAHPASILLVGGLGIWAIYARREQLARLWHQRRVRWIAVVLGLVAAGLAMRFVYLLQSWISLHDQKPNSANEFLLHIPGKSGIKQIVYIMGFMESLTVPLVLAGILGIYLLWQGRDRSLGVLLAWMLFFPMAFLVLLSFRAPVSVFYLVPTLPILFIGAGIFLDRLAELRWELRPHWLLPAAVVLIIIAAGAPTLLSQYRDGRRYDFRGAARWLHARLNPGDVIFSDQFKVLTHYLPGAQIQRLGGDPTPLIQSARTLQESRRGTAVWVVSPAPSHAFRTNPRIGELKGWIYSNCELRNTIGVGRLDFRLYHLQIYRCPAARTAAVAAETSE